MAYTIDSNKKKVGVKMKLNIAVRYPTLVGKLKDETDKMQKINHIELRAFANARVKTIKAHILDRIIEDGLITL